MVVLQVSNIHVGYGCVPVTGLLHNYRYAMVGLQVSNIHVGYGVVTDL